MQAALVLVAATGWIAAAVVTANENADVVPTLPVNAPVTVVFLYLIWRELRRDRDGRD